ncbi:MAG: hypothetical protein AAB922_06225 [Patescibacteria group bacterium]
MSYPRTVVLEDEKLRKLLEAKAELITQGRVISDEIVQKEADLEQIDKDIQAVEKTVEADDIKKKAEEITLKFNEVLKDMDLVKKELYDRMREGVGKELPAKYEAVKAEKEKLENDRNKIALKVQKFNDKAIPIGRRLMKPNLENEFEDYDSLRIENGQVVGTIFSHLDDFEKRFREKKLRN